MEGAGCVGGQEKEWMGCFLDDLRAFDFNAYQWTNVARDERGMAQDGGTRGGMFRGEMDWYRKQGLDYGMH